MAPTHPRLHPIDPSISEKFANHLDPLINGSWAELYCGQTADADAFYLLLLVGEPKRRQMNDQDQTLLSAFHSAVKSSRVTFFIVSPESIDKLKKESAEKASLTKSLTSPRFKVKGW